MLATLFAMLLAAPVQLSIAQGSTIVIEGDSSMHPWKCQAKFDGAGEAGSMDAAASLTAFEIGIPVKDIRCGSDTMEEKLRDALKAPKFSRIDFSFTSATPMPAGAKGTLKVIGKIALAGVEKPVTAVVTVARGPGNAWIATAAVPLKMTDFGVEPPTAMLGIMKTHDAITIRVNLKVSALEAQPHVVN